MILHVGQVPMLVLNIGFGVSCPKLLPTNRPNIFFVTACQHCLGKAKPKNVLRSTLNFCIKMLRNLKSFLFNRFFYWLHDYLMPSDKHNSITAKAMGLISSLVSSWEVPFHQLQQLQCSFYQSLPLFSFPFSTTMLVMTCSSAASWLHGRLSNCSDCRSDYHAVLLLKTLCKMLDNTETKRNCPLAFSLGLNDCRGMCCHAWIFRIST